MLKDIIGISLGNNTSVAVYSPDNGIKFALSEERLTGEKGTKKFPINALKEAVKLTNYDSTLRIALSSYEVINERTLKYLDLGGIAINKNMVIDFYQLLENKIRKECNIDHTIRIQFFRVDHHTAHRVPAIYMSGFIEQIDPYGIPLVAITADGFGDGLSMTMQDYQTQEILARETIETSIGLIYQYVTGALGFKEHRHEGKVTGLAAYGKPLYKDAFKNKIMDYDKATFNFIPVYLQSDKSYNFDDQEINANIKGFKNMLKLKYATYDLVNNLLDDGAKPEDIAASVQFYSESMLHLWVNNLLDHNMQDEVNLVVSGGIFANVNFNMVLKNSPSVKDLFVLPASGDEGTAIGAAIQMAINEYGKLNLNLKALTSDDLYLGKIKGKELDTCDIDGSKYIIEKDVSVHTLAKYLEDDKTIAFSIGYHEFGGRALGNHSIIAKASNKKIVDRLNVALDRNEFMPLAPFTIDLFAEDLFPGQLYGVKKTLKNMTLALKASTDFQEKYPAVVHVDNSVRVQVIEEHDNLYVYRLMLEYSKMTNEKVLINTSFNKHDSPIVFSEQDAYQAFVEADLDVLVLDNKILRKR